MIQTESIQGRDYGLATPEVENLCGLLEKKNKWLGWSTRSVRLKDDYIEYSKRNGKTRMLKLADIVSVSAKGVEVEFIVLDDVKQFKLKLRAENEILAYRWLRVVEAARRKLNKVNNSKMTRSGSETRLNHAASPGLLKRQATTGDLPFELFDEATLANHDERGAAGSKMIIVESPRAEEPVASEEESEDVAAQKHDAQLTKPKVDLPDVIGGFAKDLILVFVQPVFQALHIFVNSLKKKA